VQIAELIESARSLMSAPTGLLVATDFDGTLAPIVADPELSRPVAGAVSTLATLVARGARVAVVTGRDAATAVRLGGLDAVPGIEVLGLYGLERWHGGRLERPAEPEAIRRLRAALPSGLGAADDGVWVEDKGLSLVVHTRTAQDPGAVQDRLRERARRLAEHLGLELHDGRFVLEFRLAGHDKGTVVRQLARGGRVLYSGDDLGDLPAFAAAREAGGWSVAVASAEAPEVAAAADVVVPDPDALVGLWRAIAG